MIGGTLMQTLILLYVTYQADWDKEVMLHEIKSHHIKIFTILYQKLKIVSKLLR